MELRFFFNFVQIQELTLKINEFLLLLLKVWEIFSLGETPYHKMNFSQVFSNSYRKRCKCEWTQKFLLNFLGCQLFKAGHATKQALIMFTITL